jgi:hypothetical protein
VAKREGLPRNFCWAPAFFLQDRFMFCRLAVAPPLAAYAPPDRFPHEAKIRTR